MANETVLTASTPLAKVVSAQSQQIEGIEKMMPSLKGCLQGSQGSGGRKLRNIQRFLVAAGVLLSSGCSSWNVAVPPNSHRFGIPISNRNIPDYLERVVTLGPPPKTADDSYRIMIARCQASEREKRLALTTYRSAKWTLLPLGLASSSASVALTAINDPSATGWSDSARTQMRVWSVISGGIGVLLGTVYGLVGFDTRIDVTTKDLVAMRTVMDRARSQWAQATNEDRRALLLDMARRCNSEEQIEQLISNPSNAAAANKKLQEVMDDIAEAEGIIKDIEDNVLKKTSNPSENETTDHKALSVRVKDLRAVLVELARDFIAEDPDDLTIGQNLLSKIHEIDGLATAKDPATFNTQFSKLWGEKGKNVTDLLESAKKSIQSKENSAAAVNVGRKNTAGRFTNNMVLRPDDTSQMKEPRNSALLASPIP